jgi:hypothetical protein
MKKLELSLGIALFCLLLVTCKKEPIETEFPYGVPDSCSFLLCHLDHFYDMGECRAVTNYKDWNTYARYRILGSDSSRISFDFHRVPQGGCEQTETIHLLFYTLQLEDDQKPLVLYLDKLPTAGLYTHGGGYDTISELYILDPDKESVVYIDSFDPDKEEITGTFELHFVFDETGPPKYDKNRPDTLSFKNGTFRAAKYRWCE